MLRVTLSGRIKGSRAWSSFEKSQGAVKLALLSLYPDIEFVKSAKADFIVIPDNVDHPSKTALKSAGQPIRLKAF